MIVSSGRSSGVPHYVGDRNDVGMPLTGTEIIPPTSNAPSLHCDGTVEKQVGGVAAGIKYSRAIVPQLQPRSLHQQGRSQPQRSSIRTLPPYLPQATHTPGNVVHDVLPYCSAGPPLGQEHVIALTDVVGNLQELVLFTLSAGSGDVRCMDELENAVGRQTARSIVQFFSHEFEIEG